MVGHVLQQTLLIIGTRIQSGKTTLMVIKLAKESVLNLPVVDQLGGLFIQYALLFLVYHQSSYQVINGL